MNLIALWAGRAFSTLAVLFFLMDAVMKMLRARPAVEATTQLGFSPTAIMPIGVTLFVCTILYVYPRTAFIGAILLTGYLGGAAASSIRAGSPLFNCAFPIIFAVLVWAGLVLREPRLLSLLAVQ